MSCAKDKGKRTWSMSKLNIDQQTIRQLFSDKKADFLIPDYQRPYAWGENECQTLWDDIFTFAFPDNDYSKFDSDSDEYFLGPIVTFKNENAKLEVIDGQQRLTTLMLLINWQELQKRRWQTARCRCSLPRPTGASGKILP